MRLAAVVPVKRFTAAKGRLTGVLTSDERATLARWMATRVLQVIGEIPTYVACDDDDVADWARRLGAEVVWGAGLGLNGAVDDGVAHVASAGFEHVIVAHADLARPESLLDVATDGQITLVPDGRDDGTNVMAFPIAHRIGASYGGGSFSRHLAQALEADCPVEVRRDPDLALDLDTEADLIHPRIRPLLSEVLPAWPRTNPDNRTRPR